MEKVLRTSLCIFCYKQSLCLEENKSLDKSEKTARRFLLLLSRYLNVTPGLVTSCLEICEDCCRIGESFCDQYFQWECVKMQLDWKVRRLCDTMKCADKVPSRYKAFQDWAAVEVEGNGVIDESRKRKDFNEIQSLRKEIISKYERHAKDCAPIVFMSNCEPKGTSNITVSRSVEQYLLSEIEAHGNDTGNAGVLKLEVVSPQKNSSYVNTERDLLTVLMLSLMAVINLSNINCLNGSVTWVSDSMLDLYDELDDCRPEPECQESQDVSASVDEFDDFHIFHDDIQPLDSIKVDDVSTVEVWREVSNNTSKTKSVLKILEAMDEFCERAMSANAEQEQPMQNIVLDAVSEMEMEIGTDNNAIETTMEDELNELVKSSVDVDVGITESDDVPSPVAVEKETVPPIQSKRSLRSLLKCSKCLKTFTTQANLNSHMESHVENEIENSSSEDESIVDASRRGEDNFSGSDYEAGSGKEESGDGMDVELKETCLGNNSKLVDIKPKIAVGNNGSVSKSMSMFHGEKRKASFEAVSNESQQFVSTSGYFSRLIKPRLLSLPENQCEICNEQLSCKGAVEKHRYLTHGQRLFVHCPTCGKWYSDHYYMLDHIRGKPQCKPTDPKKLKPGAAPLFPYRSDVTGNKFCPEEGCFEVFEYDEWLSVHLRTHGTWHCGFCTETFSKAHDLALHEVNKHGKNVKSLSNEDEKANNWQQNEGYKCLRCNHPSQVKRRLYVNHFLQTHLEISTIPPKEKSKHICSICNDVLGPTRSAKSINGHMQMHKVEGLDPKAISVCPECQAPFKLAYWLTIHLRRVHGITEPHKCPHCEKKFKTPTYLKAHLISDHKLQNTGLPGPYECLTCGERFQHEKFLANHKKTHEPKVSQEQEVHNCSMCEQTFKTKMRLKFHIENVHEPPKKTYCCDQCGKSFKTTVKLNQHTSYVHTDPSQWKFACPEDGCGRKCWSRQKLREHIRTHTKETPYVCEFCGVAHRYPQYLRAHLEKVHGTTAAATLPARSYFIPFDKQIKASKEKTTKTTTEPGPTDKDNEKRTNVNVMQDSESEDKQ